MWCFQKHTTATSDRNNAGLSAIASFGQLTGGGLFLWPNDQGAKGTKIDDLKRREAGLCDIHPEHVLSMPMMGDNCPIV